MRHHSLIPKRKLEPDPQLRQHNDQGAHHQPPELAGARYDGKSALPIEHSLTKGDIDMGPDEQTVYSVTAEMTKAWL